ncbi:MAG: thiamine phosphate synthase [Candidatus Eiseniibacteriota bacterium]|jgi:thiamine-phosphate diphosphorylase
MLIVVSDGRGEARPIDSVAAAAAAGGAWAFLLREPRLGGAALLATARRLRAAHPGLRLVVSDRADVALAAGAHGVQLGERGLPAARVRHWCGARLAIGRSVHDAVGAGRAARDGAAWALFGHVFESASKPGLAPAGVASLRAAVAAAACPVLALGGITPARVAPVVAAGAAGVAVLGAVCGADDPHRAVVELVEALRAAGRPAGAAGSRVAVARGGEG